MSEALSLLVHLQIEELKQLKIAVDVEIKRKLEIQRLTRLLS